MNLLDLLFPKRCFECGRFGRYFCASCAAAVRMIEGREAICPVCERPAIDGATHPRCRTRYGIDGLISFFHYDGVIKRAVKAIKYRFVSDAVAEFVSRVSSSSFFNGSLKQWNDFALVPIPLHPARMRQRGFNQAEILGSLVAARLNIPVRPDMLKRVKKTTPQVEMRDRNDRLKNMHGVFAIDSHGLTQRPVQNVVLFDDVFTTGATMRAAANVLKRSGVSHVWGMTMAR